MKHVTVKVIEYELAEHADREAFLRTSAVVMPAIETLKGFIKRELLEGEDGRWRDVVYWESRQDADQSEVEISELPACVTCIAMMDHSDMTVTHFALIQESSEPWWM